MALDDTFTVAPVNQINSAGDTWALITEKFTGKPFNELVRCAWTWIKGLRG